MKRAGFTLIELLVSVSIIAILIAIGIASYSTINKRARDTKRKSDLEQVRSALEMYRAENAFYPNSGAGEWTSASDLDSVLVPTYIPAIPLDPKNSGLYIYYYLATNNSDDNYYGYCLSANFESSPTTANTCTPLSDPLIGTQNYGVKNP